MANAKIAMASKLGRTTPPKMWQQR